MAKTLFKSTGSRILAVFFALAMLFALGATPANAGTCTKVGSQTFCGVINVAGSSQCAITIYSGWPGTTKNDAILRPGQSSKSIFKDTDGYAGDTRCDWALRTTSGSYKPAATGPVKTNDLNNITLVGFRK